MKFADELRKTQESRTIVRAYRKGAPTSYIAGYVTGVSSELVAMLAIVSGVHFDGFIVFRLKDICGLRIPGDWAEFTERALMRRKEQRPNLELDLRSWRTVIESSRGTFPIADFQCFDAEDNGFVTWSRGHAIHVDDEIVKIRPIDPGGTWESVEELFSLRTLIRMDFGGDLEVMLGELAHEK